MKLTHLKVLETVAGALTDQIVPHLTDKFAIEATRQASAVVSIVALAMDDAVEIRLAETTGLRAMLRQGQALDLPAPLAARLAEGLQSDDPGLRISALDAEIARLRLLLVELHEWTEGQTTAGARALDQAIWRTLREGELARAPKA